MRRLTCHATDCNALTSETFFYCEMHGEEDNESLLKTGEK